jgi:hypothetical protein
LRAKPLLVVILVGGIVEQAITLILHILMAVSWPILIETASVHMNPVRVIEYIDHAVEKRRSERLIVVGNTVGAGQLIAILVNL